VQGLVRELFRQWFVVEKLLQERLRGRTRPRVRHLLGLALAELLAAGEQDEGHAARVVHHAVQSGRRAGFAAPELGLVNAVLRGLLRGGLPAAGAERDRANHPQWLVERWESSFGVAATEQLLRWNQRMAEHYVVASQCPEYAEATTWRGVWRVRGGVSAAIDDLAHGVVTLVDPFATVPVELLAPRPGEQLLDLCAAPGGKSRQLALGLAGRGRLWSVDRPGPRLQRLQANLEPFAAVSRVIGSTVEELEGAAHGLREGGCDGVLIDVPCSNTGVIRRRPDVRVRLRPQAIGEAAQRQRVLLEAAAKWVKPGGRLVYSTCSLEREENEAVVDDFIAGHSSWQVEGSQLSRPWEQAHDGGGAFLLRRAAG
jgi:16S rRNA (cytosine967-C5)-methyltransferase